MDAKATFGELKFSALRRENFVQDEDGNSTGELKGRTYDLKSKEQGMMIQVSLPADAAEKNFDYDTPVELVEPTVDTVATATFGGRATAGWYIKAKDIVAAAGGGTGANAANTKAQAEHANNAGTGAQTGKKG